MLCVYVCVLLRRTVYLACSGKKIIRPNKAKQRQKPHLFGLHAPNKCSVFLLHVATGYVRQMRWAHNTIEQPRSINSLRSARVYKTSTLYARRTETFARMHLDVFFADQSTHSQRNGLKSLRLLKTVYICACTNSWIIPFRGIFYIALEVLAKKEKPNTDAIGLA